MYTPAWVEEWEGECFDTTGRVESGMLYSKPALKVRVAASVSRVPALRRTK